MSLMLTVAVRDIGMDRISGRDVISFIADLIANIVDIYALCRIAVRMLLIRLIARLVSSLFQTELDRKSVV